jgi:hypothetical protein
VISFGISVKECKFTEIFIWHRPQGILKVINVSWIRIVVNCLQILYTNKTVRLYYMAPTMRNGLETVIRTIARACPEESISWSHCVLEIVERWMVSRSYKPVEDGHVWSVSNSRRRCNKPVFTGFPLLWGLSKEGPFTYDVIVPPASSCWLVIENMASVTDYIYKSLLLPTLKCLVGFRGRWWASQYIWSVTDVIIVETNVASRRWESGESFKGSTAYM